MLCSFATNIRLEQIQNLPRQIANFTVPSANDLGQRKMRMLRYKKAPTLTMALFGHINRKS